MGFQHGAGFSRYPVSIVFGQRHAPVQAQTCPVDNKTGFFGNPVEVSQGVSCIPPRIHSNVGVIHDVTVLNTLAFILQFRGHSHLIHESGAADLNVPGKIATIFDNRSTARQFSFKN